MYKSPKKFKKINIMGTDVPIIIDDLKLAHMGAMGCFSAEGISMLSQYPSRGDYVDTLTHECFHALSHILGTQLDPHVEEILANTVGQLNVEIVQKLLVHQVIIDVVEEDK